MKAGSRVLSVLLALGAAWALVSAAASAEGPRARPVDGDPRVARPMPSPLGPRSFGHRPTFERSFDDRPFGRHFDRGFARRFPAITVFGPPFVAYAPPVVYGPSLDAYGPPADDALTPVGYGPPAYPTAPVAYPPPVAPAPVAAPAPVEPPPAPMPRVVEYPTGRYELRGDGVMTAYQWVWIPYPPPFPPDAMPSAPLSPDPPSSRRPAAARPVQLYHWTDTDGVEHWTDRWEAVPDEYRGQVKPPRAS
jgi:hypothetical protein